MEKLVTCAACHRSLKRSESYLVRIEALADPGTPAIDTKNTPDASASVSQLLEQIRKMTAEELQDQVYRHFEYRLCGRCHQSFLTNPLGLPRHRVHGRN